MTMPPSCVDNKKTAGANDHTEVETSVTSGTEGTTSPESYSPRQASDGEAPGMVHGDSQAVMIDGPAIPAVVVSDEQTSGEESPPPPAELSEEKKAAVIKQVEFYFSDENLPTDKFMKQKMQKGGAQGWVSLQVIANFNKLKKLSKDVRAIAAALESSEALVVEKKGGKYFRVRRKIPFKFPNKDDMSDISSRTVLAVNIPADSSVDSLTRFFSACGVVETVRIFRKSDPRNKDLQPPVGASRDFYATCQYASAEEAIKAVNDLTDRKSWRGGLRVTLANRMPVEKAAAKLKANAAGQEKRTKNERDERSRSPVPGERNSPRPDGQRKRRSAGYPSSGEEGAHTGREGQARSRSLTELELENASRGGKGGGGDKGGVVSELTAPPDRKPRSESNVDALFSNGDDSPPRHPSGDKVPLKGVVQTVVPDGMSWIKREGAGSRKSGGRVPFSAADVITKDGEPSGPLQKGDHVEYHTWRDKEGTLMAVRVEKIKDRTRSTGVGGGMGAGAQRRTDRAAPAHFRMAMGPEEGKTGFAAGRGRPLATPPAEGGGIPRRPRGSSMGGPDAKEFVPSSAMRVTPPVVTPDLAQFEDAR